SSRTSFRARVPTRVSRDSLPSTRDTRRPATARAIRVMEPTRTMRITEPLGYRLRREPPCVSSARALPFRSRCRRSSSRTRNASLASVQADESALNAVDGRLAILQWVALPSGGTIAGERQRLKTALDGLKHADAALTAGSNLGKVALPTYDTMIDFTKMYTALGKHDLVGAAAPYPDAQQKLQEAISQDQAAGVPAAAAKQLRAL